MSTPTIFQICQPRADVLQGTIRDDEFAADLSSVINGTAPPDYLDPALFFAKTYPTRGIRELLKAVLQRISGKGGEVSSIIRLGTQYGGGKTHGLVAAVHGARGMKGVPNVADFVDPSLVPTGRVRIAALDGENSDPANGLTLEGDLRAKSLWGEMAYKLAGRAGYERVRVSDETHTAPGAETIRELFGGEPTLILLDEVSVYLRKVEHVRPGASKQFAAFIHDLFKAVQSSPQVALVYTLAVGKGNEATDAYKVENELAAAAMAEAEAVAVRTSTTLNPTEEDETPNVLRARLFESVDLSAAKGVIAAYADIWDRNKEDLKLEAGLPELREAFLRSYPLHPKLLEMLTEKTASLSTFQRTRGMLRLLARGIFYLWRNKPADAFAIHTHHLDPAFEPIRTEVNVKLGQSQYAPAVKADVAAVANDEPALAQQIDKQKFPGMPPITSYVARTIYWHTLAYGDAARGISADQLKLSVCSPAVEPAFIEQARVQFIAESLFLDDHPGAPMRFMVEPNLTMIIRKRMSEIDPNEVRAELGERIRNLFSLPRGEFNAILFPSSPYDVPDEIGDGRPLLVVMNYESTAVPANAQDPPPDVVDMFTHRGNEGKPRELKNNLVFVAADERSIQNMREHVRRSLALKALLKPENQKDLAPHQRTAIQSDNEKIRLDVAMSILQCYRHLYYPSSDAGSLGHSVIELSGAGDSPGNGQHQVIHVLHEQGKLRTAQDTPEAPGFVMQQVGLKSRGEMTTAQLRTEYRRAPKLSILLQDTPLLECIRRGIAQGYFIYQEGSQVYGPGDPPFTIHISDNSFLHTTENAKAKHLWPRTAPLRISFRSNPTTINPGELATLELQIEGGVAPYTIASSEALLNASATNDAVHTVKVNPAQSMSYRAEVTDARGQRQESSTIVNVRVAGSPGLPPPPPPPDLKPAADIIPAELNAEGPLPQALEELWEKARKAKFPAIAQLTIRLFAFDIASKLHSAIATLAEAEAVCEYSVDLEAEGVDQFHLDWRGRYEKAHPVRSFLETQIRNANESDVKAAYTLAFKTPLSLKAETVEQLRKKLTQYGGGEAYVEARAAKE
ncbi:MAG TPA: DUF499 domain-containing protein [Bryobacteraceae bacterium]|nr:DUF499 domain-containing protein [Bryobacteraceae bacterium]